MPAYRRRTQRRKTLRIPDSIPNALDYGGTRLRAYGLESREALIQAEWLLVHVIGSKRDALRSRRMLTEAESIQYARLLDRRVDRDEPVQYITGQQSFMGYDFAVDPRVLIPRLDTEMLCVHALEACRGKAAASVLDVGTGCGALAVSIALSRPHASVTALDISEDALDVARQNAKRLNASVRFLQSDFFTGLPKERFDVIVSNPPYVTLGEWDSLPPDVRQEPRQALYGGVDGLDAYRVLARDSADHMASGGRIIVEVGASQADTVSGMFAEGIGPAEALYDLQGVRRFVSAALRE